MEREEMIRMIDGSYHCPELNPDSDGHLDGLLAMDEGKVTMRLSDEYFDTLNDQIRKFNKKAVKIGFPPVVVEIGERKLEKKYEYSEVIGQQWWGQMWYLTEVSIEYPYEVKISGWQFVAKMEAVERGTIVSHVPGCDVELPGEFRDHSFYCDHCKTDRFRSAVFVLVNESGEFKQVGSTCLKDFLGHKNPAEILSYIGGLQHLSRVVAGIQAGDDDIFDQYGAIGGRSPEYLDTEFYLSHVIAVAEAKGFVTRSQSNGKTPTSEWARDNIRDVAARKRGRFGAPVWIDVTDKHVEEAAAMLEWGRDHYQKLMDAGKATDYDGNMDILLEGENFDAKYTGYVASLYLTYKKHLETLQHWDEHYLWNVGDKLAEMTGRVVSVVPVNSYYGVCYLTKFNIQDHIVVSFVGKELEQGKEYTFKDIEVLTHEEYYQEHQTKVKINMRLRVNREEAAGR